MYGEPGSSKSSPGDPPPSIGKRSYNDSDPALLRKIWRGGNENKSGGIIENRGKVVEHLLSFKYSIKMDTGQS
jgi:hypothetical protein